MKHSIPEGHSRSPSALATALAVAMASFLQMLDSSIIGTALPKMAITFGVGPVDVGMGIVAYVLAAAIMLPSAAWLADRFEPRRVFVLAVLGFSATSLLCALATTLPLFVTARLLQGAAGALMSAIGQLILVRSFERSSLLRLMNISTIPMLVAPVLGPPLGGFLTQVLGWPSIFYLNLPLGLGVSAAAMICIAPLPRQIRPFDGIGFGLIASTLALLIFGLERLTGASSRDVAILSLAVGTATGWLAIRHVRRHSHPILSLAPLQFQTFRTATITALPIIRLPINAFLFVVPIQMQVALGMSVLLSSVVLLAHAAGDLSVKPVMTRTYRRFGYRSVLIISTVSTTLGIGLCGVFTNQTPLPAILFVAFLTGVTRSFAMTGLNTLAFDEIPHTQFPSAVTLGQMMMQGSAACSVALVTIVFDIARAWMDHSAGATVSPQDCRIVFFSFAVIGLLATPSLLGLPRTVGDRLSGRAKSVPLEE